MNDHSPAHNADPLAHLPINRWGVGTVAVGKRVIVRRELTAKEAAQSGKKVTDVIGYVVSLDPFVVRPQQAPGKRAPEDAPAIDFSPYSLVTVKALPERTVRNADIRAVELATAKAFPGTEHKWVGDWLLRAGDGITERSNSALPVGPGAGTQPVPLQDIRDFYARHQLPVRIAVPDRICKPAQALVQSPGWSLGPEIIVMTRELGNLPAIQTVDGITAEVLSQPDAEWLNLYHFRGKQLPHGALELLRKEIDGRMCFGQLVLTTDGERRTVAITRGTLTESDDGRTWLGFSAVEVAPDLRRRGLGTLLGLHMMQWGAESGADSAYLQVVDGNDAGVALYRSLGFAEHHRHRYALWEG
ncbi:N-acetylglutamate synthase, CG3035 family [Corynebacterium sp. H113]|uniref:N-acetylglutamate synthase, CG3035 family n=1 Tax=Corynebacterium sp. H113 TaxID=3133419 RepID=UPI00309AB1D6